MTLASCSSSQRDHSQLVVQCKCRGGWAEAGQGSSGRSVETDLRQAVCDRHSDSQRPLLNAKLRNSIIFLSTFGGDKRAIFFAFPGRCCAYSSRHRSSSSLFHTQIYHCMTRQIQYSHSQAETNTALQYPPSLQPHCPCPLVSRLHRPSFLSLTAALSHSLLLILVGAVTIFCQSSACSEAPPTRKPSMSGWANSSSALLPFTLPP